MWYILTGQRKKISLKMHLKMWLLELRLLQLEWKSVIKELGLVLRCKISVLKKINYIFYSIIEMYSVENITFLRFYKNLTHFFIRNSIMIGIWVAVINYYLDNFVVLREWLFELFPQVDVVGADSVIEGFFTHTCVLVVCSISFFQYLLLISSKRLWYLLKGHLRLLLVMQILCLYNFLSFFCGVSVNGWGLEVWYVVTDVVLNYELFSYEYIK